MSQPLVSPDHGIWLRLEGLVEFGASAASGLGVRLESLGFRVSGVFKAWVLLGLGQLGGLGACLNS